MNENLVKIAREYFDTPEADLPARLRSRLQDEGRVRQVLGMIAQMRRWLSPGRQPPETLLELGPYYRLGRLLARGAMGEVYEATDPFGRQVALKRLALG